MFRSFKTRTLGFDGVNETWENMSGPVEAVRRVGGLRVPLDSVVCVGRRVREVREAAECVDFAIFSAVKQKN